MSNMSSLLLLPEALADSFSFSLQYAFSPQLVLPERFGLAALEQYDGIEDPGNFPKKQSATTTRSPSSMSTKLLRTTVNTTTCALLPSIMIMLRCYEPTGVWRFALKNFLLHTAYIIYVVLIIFFEVPVNGVWDIKLNSVLRPGEFMRSENQNNIIPTKLCTIDSSCGEESCLLFPWPSPFKTNLSSKHFACIAQDIRTCDLSTIQTSSKEEANQT